MTQSTRWTPSPRLTMMFGPSFMAFKEGTVGAARAVVRKVARMAGKTRLGLCIVRAEWGIDQG